MDGRDVMALPSGSSPYFIHRGGGIGESESGSQLGPLHYRPVFRPVLDSNIPVQSSSKLISTGPVFSADSSNAPSGHGLTVPMPGEGSVGETVKKKRGRPRKYAPDGQVSLGLTPLPAKPKPSDGDDSTTPKQKKGRPPGSGRKQQLAKLGEWMNSSAGTAFAPHVIHIEVGEDIVAKVMSFSQQRPRAVCIMSGTGTVSSVTLCAPASSEPTIKFEGRFEILCLSGSYLVPEDGGGPHSRTGGISASLSSSDGHVIGGAVQTLIAASPVQIVACSFVYGSSKNKDRPVGRPSTNDGTPSQPIGGSATPREETPATRNTSHNTDIDLMRG